MALFVAIIGFTPAIPIPSESIDVIASGTQEHSLGIRLGLYLAALMTFALIVFASAVAVRLQRAGSGDWWMLCGVGAATLSMGLASEGDVLSFVRAVGHGVRGDALWMSYPPAPDGFGMAVPAGVFLLGAGLGGLASGAFSAWLCRLAVVLSGGFLAGGAGIVGNEVDGGPFGLVLVLSFVGMWVWTVAISIRLWRTNLLVAPEAGVARAEA
ncbi:hypothetical protein [Nocardioides sp. XL1]|uniref:hypothetical protein n=1 Tax=Nocardioides sp. XL1 TaxID=2003120 RepID=UPI001121692D|nr:hypothetical protein [Nocardioides sp. XL1]